MSVARQTCNQPRIPLTNIQHHRRRNPLWERACSRRGQIRHRINFFVSKPTPTGIPFQGEIARGLEIDRDELNLVPSLELPQLPKVRLDHRHRADKATEARAIGTEDYWHVTSEVHRANRVRIVMNIRRMQSRFTTVGPHPFRLRPDQPHTGAA